MKTSRLRLPVIAGAFASLTATHAIAADASDWDQDARAGVRLIAGNPPAGATDGTQRAGIEIKLASGWKTYWRYPGDSGVPPRFDFKHSENVKSVTVLWPAPHRFSDEEGQTIGYKDHVVFPLRVIPQDKSKPVTLKLDLDYAVCDKLCVPMSSIIELPLEGGASKLDNLLTAAEARIPAPGAIDNAAPGDGKMLAIKSVHRDVGAAKPQVVVDVVAPKGGKVDLLAEGPTPDWALPLPKAVPGAPAGEQRFTFDLDGLPTSAKAEDADLTLTATISTASEGTVAVSQTITASTYMGVQTCSACHSGSVLAEDKWHSWITTGHSHIFTDEINGQASLHGTSCLQCHTTGYSYNTNVMDGGFSSMAAQYGWTIPSVLTNGNWESMQTNYPEVAKMANVQCESCHGPGFNHASLFGNTNSPAWPSISVSYDSGDCNQCHDAPTHHVYGTEWLSSMHAVTTTHPSGPGEESCVGCHTGKGFIQRLDGVTNNIDTAYNPINCQACHEPHGETVPTNNPGMIRTLASATFADGTIVTNGGKGLLCMQCHHARQNASTYANNPNNASPYFGPHHGPQGDMIEGVNGYTYGQDIPSSAHGKAVPDTCVTCHMQKLSTSDPAFLKAGGHTWEMSYGDEDLVAACQTCHGSSVTSFDIALKDYDGDGVVEGVQTEVQHLLDKLSTLLPNKQGVIDGQVKVPVTAKTWTAPQMEAAYNYAFVHDDGSYGIHNTAYTVGLLKASIANLTGDANNDGLPDSWQIQYFGSTTAPEAAPNAVNNASGAPNWMMYALGLAPTAAFTVDGSGTVFFNGNNIVNGATNTIAIYTAAEIAFDTQAGTSYQIQGISNLSGTWSNISTNIPGTGGTISYVVPTRDTAQMFFRVVHTP